MSGREVRVGTRGSALALAQARLVVDALARAGVAGRLVTIETQGDRRAPDTAWGEGAFVAAIEEALLDDRVDIAVHSAKDIPTDEDPRLVIAAYLPRADARDALVIGQASDGADGRLEALPSGARVGTDSPRRTGFVLALRPDLRVQPIHGNVDTRLRRLDAGEVDALVLACAGLDRLGLGGRIAQRIDPDIVPPAPGQGAIAIQVRRDDLRLAEVASAVDDLATRCAVEAERAFLHASGGGCRAPIGALATIAGGTLELLGGTVAADGTGAGFGRRSGPVALAATMARALARTLARSPAAWPARSAVPVAGESSGLAPGHAPRVLVTRAVTQADDLVAALRSRGLDTVLVPAIAVESEPPGGRLDAAVEAPGRYAWVVLTSPNGAHALIEAAERARRGAADASPSALAGSRIAAVGSGTGRLLEAGGMHVAFAPSSATAAAVGDELPVRPGDRVLVVRGDLAGGRLAAALQARGAEVDDVVAYRTREAPDGSRALLREAVAAGPVAAATFTSGSTVRGLLALAAAESIDVRSLPAACIGPETAAAARRAGFARVAVASAPDAAALADAAAGLVAVEAGAAT